MNIKSIARPYANAAFSAATKANQLPLWSLALKKLSLAVCDSKMQSALKNPTYMPKQLSELLNAFTDLLPIQNFIQLLAEKKRLTLLPSISELFEADCAKAAGYLSLTVTSAWTMDDAQRNNTRDKLSKQLNSKCEIEFKVNEKLIGGILVRSGSWVMDGTIKGALSRLKSVLA